jgi:hypothetical protein
MPRVVLHNYLPSRRSVGTFRATAPAHDHGADGCHCGGSCDSCKTHGHDEGSKAESFLREVCGALNNYNGHVQKLAAAQFNKGASVPEAIKYIRKSVGAFDSATTADLGIDVTYTMGKLTETRHYTVSGIVIDQGGHGPQPGAVASELRKLPEHRRMIQGGWRAERAEGYFKQEQRDVGRMI